MLCFFWVGNNCIGSCHCRSTVKSALACSIAVAGIDAAICIWLFFSNFSMVVLGQTFFAVAGKSMTFASSKIFLCYAATDSFRSTILLSSKWPAISSSSFLLSSSVSFPDVLAMFVMSLQEQDGGKSSVGLANLEVATWLTIRLPTCLTLCLSYSLCRQYSVIWYDSIRVCHLPSWKLTS